MEDNSPKKIFSQIQLGPYTLNNRIAMAPLTRMRCDKEIRAPNDMSVQYYSERAESAGLVISECTAVSLQGTAFPGGPGIFTDEQIAGWARVTEAVHKVGGRIYLQIWHAGRASRSAQSGLPPVSATTQPIRVSVNENGEYKTQEIPEALTEEGILNIVEDFRKGAENALKAGFDGLELHGANGYLIDQFLRDGSNKRTDNYGGSIENRCRFPLLVMDALISVFGADRVGIKVTPAGRFQDMFDSDPIPLYNYFLSELNKRKVSYVHFAKAPEFVASENFYGPKGEEQIPDMFGTFRNSFDGIIIGNNGITFDQAWQLVEENKVDMIAYGKDFISNPDLVERLKNGLELTKPDFKTFYTPGPEGYIDYPKYKSTNIK
jgi:N-ethylmaleimide reductase